MNYIYKCELNIHTGQFISTSGIPDFCRTVTVVTPKGSMSTEGEALPKSLSSLICVRYLLSSVSVLVVAQPISEVPEGLKNYPVLCPVPSDVMARLPRHCGLNPYSWDTHANRVTTEETGISPEAHFLKYSQKFKTKKEIS
jgi:hypothetical protein